MSLVEFIHKNGSHALNAGDFFHEPTAAAFSDTSGENLAALIEGVKTGTPWRQMVDRLLQDPQPWLHQIIRSPKRTRFFNDLLPDQPGTALDIGCGYGQMTLPLLAASWQVASLDPSENRLRFVQEVSRQEQPHERATFICADYLDTHFQTRFDLCLCIGVLEWVGAFQSQGDPMDRQRFFLRKARKELAPGGTLIIGIENRIGLKYLLGCDDDHIGAPNIACLPGALANRIWREKTGQPLSSYTYTQAELEALLREAGFQEIEFFAALPDYKLTEELIPLSDQGSAFNAGMLSGELFRPEHNGYDGSVLPTEFQDRLQGTYASFAMQGIAHHFAPSFFVKAK